LGKCHQRPPGFLEFYPFSALRGLRVQARGRRHPSRRLADNSRGKISTVVRCPARAASSSTSQRDLDRFGCANAPHCPDTWGKTRALRLLGRSSAWPSCAPRSIGSSSRSKARTRLSKREPRADAGRALRGASPEPRVRSVSAPKCHGPAGHGGSPARLRARSAYRAHFTLVRPGAAPKRAAEGCAAIW